MNIHFSNYKTVQLKPWQGILFGLLFVLVGVIFSFLAITTIKTYNEKNKTFIETTSKVVDYNYNDEGLQAIVVEYVVDGQTYEKASNAYSNMPKSIGTEVSIKYNPNNPKDAIWVSDSNNIILPAVGVGFTLIGIIMIIFNIRNSKKQHLIEEQEFETNSGQTQMSDNNIQPSQNINNSNQTAANNFSQPTSSVDTNITNEQNDNTNIWR